MSRNGDSPHSSHDADAPTEAFLQRLVVQTEKAAAFAEAAGPRLDSLAVAYRDLSTDYKVLAADVRKIAVHLDVVVSSTRETAEHVGGLISHAARIEGAQRAAAGAVDEQIAAIRKRLAEHRDAINALGRDRADVDDLGEITQVRTQPPISTAVETVLARRELAEKREQLKTIDERRHRWALWAVGAAVTLLIATWGGVLAWLVRR